MFFQLQKSKRYKESEEIFSKFLLPIHQRFSNHLAIFKQFPCLTLETKIILYSIKILKNLEDAKLLSKSENGENERIKLSDESFLQTNDIDLDNVNNEISILKSVDLDYETIHSEILENIIFDENDSGWSDFEETEPETGEEIERKKKENYSIFNIIKIKSIIHKSVASLFKEEQVKDEFKPLFKQEKDFEVNIRQKVKENRNEECSNNTEIKTQDITENYFEPLKEDYDNVNMKNGVEDVTDNEIVNYRKYNHLTDPNSNFNNFSKKYETKTIPKKRFKDIHPFLKTFNPKFLKKENIDKKIFRRFRKFVKEIYKKNKNLPMFKENPLFWKKFYFKNLLPPVKIKLNHNGQLIEHKSFNTQYLIWLFKQEGTSELFEIFSKNETENVINNFIMEYDINKSKEPDIIEKLRLYIKNIPEIYKENNDNKKIIFEETKENCDINYSTNNGKEDLDSIDSEVYSSNPFNLRFDELGKKHFKESSYDDPYISNEISLDSEKFDDFNDFLSRKSENLLPKFKCNDDVFCYQQSKIG